MLFWVFHVVRDYAHTLAEARERRHGPGVAARRACGERLERAVGPIELVFGHNDLLAANFIDDGKRLWLVDWDYAGFNSPLFDLGGLASNSELSLQQREALLEAYFGRPVTDELRYRYAAMTAASLLRETMWSMVSEIHSHHRLRLSRLHGGEPRPLRDGLRGLRGDGARHDRACPPRPRSSIVGGGIVGCSVAYHLGKLGCTDVLLLERAKLSSGSTWHAAGLVGQLRTSANITQLLGYSVALYDRLEAETGLATGWKRNGGLRLACNDERWTEVKRQATTAHSFGLEMHLLSPKEAQALWPLMTVDDVVGAAFLPTDGQASPSDIVQALARGARSAGVTIREDTPITGIRVENGRGARRRDGGGLRRLREARHLRRPMVARRSAAWRASTCRSSRCSTSTSITETIPGVTPDLPTLRDPDRLTYYKEEVGGLIMGGYEPNPIPWAEEGIPDGFHYTLLDADWDHFAPIMELALPRVPALETAGIKQLLNGPESFTPDGNFILGEAPEVQRLLRRRRLQRLRHRLGRRRRHGAGRVGRQGRAALRSLAGRHPPLRPQPSRRGLGPDPHARGLRQALHDGLAVRGVFSSGRPLRRSPLYDRLKAQGAVFGEKLGWERPNWFADARRRGSRGRLLATAGQNWFEAVGREHRAARERVALFDQTSFAKFCVGGRDAEAALSWICANDVAKPPGSLTYTQMLNARGGIECDLTVARLAPTTASTSSPAPASPRTISTGSAATSRTSSGARLFDVTSQNAVLALMGPRARDVLRRSRATTCRTPASRSARAGGSPSPARRCWRCASPMSASSAGSCTSRSSSPRRSTTG